jgi:hypothetical protein
MRLSAFAAAGAVALSSTFLQSVASAQPASGPATGWWYAGRSGEAPQRQLVFIDRGTVRTRAGNAGARVMAVFEQPRGDVKAFVITYGFQCRARRFQTRDAIFTTTAGTNEPEAGIAQDWTGVEPGSVAALVLDAACSGSMSNEARRIAGAPVEEAGRMFADRAPMAPTGPMPRAGAGGLLSRDELAGCLRQNAGPVSAACRNARASAERGRAGARGRSQAPVRGDAVVARDSYDQLLDRIVQADSQDWAFNRYAAGSMRVVGVQRDGRGNLSSLRGNFQYRAGMSPTGWVEARFANGRLRCLQYHNRPECISSTRDFYQEGMEAEREHAEYCAITGNC